MLNHAPDRRCLAMQKGPQRFLRLLAREGGYILKAGKGIYSSSCRCVIQEGQRDEQIVAICSSFRPCRRRYPQAQEITIGGGSDAACDPPHVDDGIVAMGVS